MINYIKIELKRAFINKTMLFAIIAGCLIAIIQIFGIKKEESVKLLKGC